MEMWYSQDPYHKLGSLQMGKIITVPEVLPKEQGGPSPRKDYPTYGFYTKKMSP